MRTARVWALSLVACLAACVQDQDGDGITAALDCDDQDPAVGLGEAWFRDADGDGYGDPEQWTQACSQPAGYVATAGDCADTDQATNPDEAERWYDGWDQDCDGADDYDQDGDGHRNLDQGGDDCDDTDPAVFPGAYDAPWDGVDADCSGGSDDDWDGDGYDADHVGGDDCDDLDQDVHPGAIEAWYDGVDQDCDGGSDYDQDGDGWDSDLEAGGGDCDDSDASIAPGAAEVWYDGTDQDCDGGSDFDQDGDGWESQDYGGLDCQDGDAEVHPGAFEWHDGDDNDCDGHNDVLYLDSAAWVIEAEQAGDGVGAVLSGAGDVDGDGLVDLLVGAPSWQGDQGAAYLLLGASAVDATRPTSLWYADARIAGGQVGDAFGAAVTAMGDVDGDGYDDVAVLAEGCESAYLLAGPLVGDLAADDARLVVGPVDGLLEGGAVIGDGTDLWGSGSAGFVLAVPEADGARGGVLLFDATASGSGSEADAVAVIEGSSVEDRAGASVAAVGDVDGDGQAELLVGVPGQSGHGSGAGAAYLFRGPLLGTLRVDAAEVSMMGVDAGDGAGTSVAAAGDTDGDGYADLLVGAPGSDTSASDGGAAYLLLGPVTDVAMELSGAHASFTGDLEGLLVGSDIAGGDVDADGYSDVLAGAPGGDLAATDNGVAYLVLGPFAGGLCTCGSDAKLYGVDSLDLAGAALVLPGDVNGDGFGDILIGAPGADAAYLVLGAER
jgi:hypothetical protein